MSKYKKGKYDTHVKPKLSLIEGWCRNGAIDVDVASNLNVAYSTFQKYKSEHKELREVLQVGKAEADIKVESALFRRAIGFKEKVVKGKLTKDGEVVNVEEEVFMPPDTIAAIFWLKNRKPKEWKDKQEVEIEGNSLVSIVNDIPGDV